MDCGSIIRTDYWIPSSISRGSPRLRLTRGSSVEKILEPGEQLRRDWPVAGTTGYEFLNVLGGMFVDREGERA